MKPAQGSSEEEDMKETSWGSTCMSGHDDCCIYNSPGSQIEEALDGISGQFHAPLYRDLEKGHYELQFHTDILAAGMEMEATTLTLQLGSFIFFQS